MRVGIGVDVHKLVKGRKLILGGVEILYEKGLEGDSDADALTHAIIDALLGGIGKGDIGATFGVGTPQVMGILSITLLEKVYEIIEEKHFIINNIDATIIAEKPKLSPYLGQMKKNIARAINIEEEEVNIKATTAKGLGIIGESGAIASIAVASVVKIG
ncbi:MAG: 2-C-methyl-D-erythritol 2,4-cyclodiphosphate synthase [bacterium]|nr:2-C-methyl-D-erythritol 2,4-cyclodiphosphate synthase [bacterium]